MGSASRSPVCNEGLGKGQGLGGRLSVNLWSGSGRIGIKTRIEFLRENAPGSNRQRVISSLKSINSMQLFAILLCEFI